MLFPYEAQNEDELSIKEGEIINIITKVSQDLCMYSMLSIFVIVLFHDFVDLIVHVLKDTLDFIKKNII